MKVKQSFIRFMSGFFVAYFDTNLFHYARVCMLIVAFDNKIAVERARIAKNAQGFFRENENNRL